MAAQSSSKKWMFIGGGVIAAVALVMFLQNYPPQPTDATGAIGAAQRYHSTQITGADVKVSQDEVTMWLQSETFDRIVKDPQARKLFTDAAVMGMFEQAAAKFGSPNVDNISKANVDNISKLSADAAVRAEAMDNAAILDALKNQAFCNALMNDALRSALLAQAHMAEAAHSNPE